MFVTPFMKQVTKKLKKRDKRTRSDRSEVEAKVFQLFEREPKWTLRQLVKNINQPEVCSLFLRLVSRNSVTCYLNLA